MVQIGSLSQGKAVSALVQAMTVLVRVMVAVANRNLVAVMLY